jgi:hypothetical protein
MSVYSILIKPYLRTLHSKRQAFSGREGKDIFWIAQKNV